MLVLNDAVALGLSLSVGTRSGLFVIMSMVFCLSLLFNLAVLRRKGTKSLQRGLRLETDDEKVKRPSLIALAVEVLGVVAFVVLYVLSTIQTANSYYKTLMKAYASIGALVAL